MRKTVSIILVGMLIAVFCSLALAEEEKEGMMGGKGMMMGKGKMTGMGNMCGMMMGSMMMGRSVAATSDGGAIVLIGNKLQKYDRNLVLKKEVEIELDMEAVKNSMKQMIKKCPMGGKMMKGGMMEGDKE